MSPFTREQLGKLRKVVLYGSLRPWPSRTPYAGFWGPFFAQLHYLHVSQVHEDELRWEGMEMAFRCIAAHYPSNRYLEVYMAEDREAREGVRGVFGEGLEERERDVRGRYMVLYKSWRRR